MTSPSPSQPFAYGQPTGSSLIPFFAGPAGPAGSQSASIQQRADVADFERFQQGSNRISTPTLPSPNGRQMAVGGSRPIGPQSSQQQQHNAQRFNDQSPMLWRNGGSGVSGGGSGFMPPTNNPHARPGNPFNSNPSLDLSEFPSLTSRDSNTNVNPMSGRTPYVGMVKNPNSESSEFHIQNEDFPALPGSNNISNNPASDITSAQANNNVKNLQNGSSNHQMGSQDQKQTTNGTVVPLGKELQQALQQRQKSAIHTSKDGRVTNIPPGMIRDQFGMVGLLTFIRVAESEPNLVSLALGSDLTTLGLNLNSQENLFTVFGGPWAEQACRPQDMEFSVPQEYLINAHIKDKLSPIKLHRYSEDTLFFIFYMYGGDIMQLVAASELYARDWRFHRDERVWITRAGINPTEKTNTYERGTYYFFDPVNWRKVAKEFHLEYDRLEERPPQLSFPSGL